MAQTRIEKIAQRFALGIDSGHKVCVGDYLRIRPRHVMTHDNTGAVIPKFQSLGANKIYDSAQPVFALDHDVQNRDANNLSKYTKIENFAKQHCCAFFKAGRGIGHQVLVEEGFILPDTFVVASDSHANMYGALGALGTPVVRTDAAAIWASGETWWQVPPAVRVELSGNLLQGVSGKDVILTLIGRFSSDQVLNCALEFCGDGVANLSLDERLCIANMTTEWGALAGVFPFDQVALDYLQQRALHFKTRGDAQPRLTLEQLEQAWDGRTVADEPANYLAEIKLDLSSVRNAVSGPDSVKAFHDAQNFSRQNIAIDKAYLMSCVGGRLNDIKIAADVAREKKFASRVKFYLAAASSEIEDQARALGYWDTLLNAGAETLPAGCGPCIGLGAGLLEKGEIGISATNRNFKGRMGSREAQVYLASPALVTASAISGHICNQTKLSETDLKCHITTPVPSDAQARKTKVRKDFPQQMQGRLLWLHRDNLDTDGIYGKEYTYRDSMSQEDMAKVVMQNYDPNFSKLAQAGDIIAAGANFGTGSSREQAATALKSAGIRLVVAESVSQTYKRNAINNGFIVLECPALINMLRSKYADTNQATCLTGHDAAVDFSSSLITFNNVNYAFAPLGEPAQELIAAQGLESWVRKRLAL